MTFLRVFLGILVRGLWVLLGGMLVGCSSSSSTTAGPVPVGPNEGIGGSTSSAAQSIVFSPADTVLLRPGESIARHVLVTPQAQYDVGLALLGDSVDAALSQSVVQTSSSGECDFSISASSVPTSFNVRASVESLTAVLPVSVSENGYAALSLSGSYSGVRQVSEWVTSLHTDGSCEELGSKLPEDGSLVTTSAVSPPSLKMANVPVGAAQSVVLRGDHLVWGCRDLPVLSADEILDLVVPLYDVPVSYGPDPIQVVFALNTNATGWSSTLTAVLPDILSGFIQSAANDSQLLLDSMRSSLGSTDAQTDFDQRRAAGDWDSIVASRWTNSTCADDECIRTALDQWLSTGAASVTQGSSIAARLSLSASSVSLNQVQLTLESMQGLAAGAWIASTEVPLTANIDANDILTASTYFSFNDGLFLRQLAQVVASAQYPGASDIPQALASLVDCDTLGTQLNDAAVGSATCNASCLAQLCRAALRNLWTNTETVARERNNSELTLNFSGTLRLDENAVVVGCDGTWLGKIDSPDGLTTTIGGAVH